MKEMPSARNIGRDNDTSKARWRSLYRLGTSTIVKYCMRSARAEDEEKDFINHYFNCRNLFYLIYCTTRVCWLSRGLLISFLVREIWDNSKRQSNMCSSVSTRWPFNLPLNTLLVIIFHQHTARRCLLLYAFSLFNSKESFIAIE